MEIWALALRTLLTYFFLLLVMRLMGKREIGKLSVFDLIISIMMAEIGVIVIEYVDEPLYKGFVPILTLMGLQLIFSYASLKNTKIRQFIDGKPSIIINNGNILEEEMRKHRYNIDDLMMQLREKNINNVADVEFAILETSGKLSVFKKEEKEYVKKEDFHSSVLLNQEPIHQFTYKGLPVPVIIEGKVQESSLQKISKTKLWLKSELRKQGVKEFKDVYFASVDHRGRLFVDRRDRI